MWKILHHQRAHPERSRDCEDIPGTTRDAVDVPFTIETDGDSRNVSSLIPQACAKKSGQRHARIFQCHRTAAAIERCDIAVLVIDAETGIVEQDKKIADLITGTIAPASW